ncbi:MULTISPECIES: cytidine deaminase [Stigmatella]|uniref:Cytidine deaminase n=2 Tax=Stigmatella TaxID=40 RepID=A0A1H7QY92_STIAU|nr:MULTISPECIES: cytidine deaminase [Stigmatella]SEL52819.1 cytidine deaminase [Stigmatella aurantiaca]SET27695.1 cytidine deaminase [Stigmatella erecta]
MATDIPWESLFQQAAKVRERAHVPYSRFPVGAAVLFADGSVVTGCNVENATYGLTVCAERNAFAAAVAQGHSRPVAVAIVVDTPTPCPPCGMCRQVMAEFAGPELPIRSRTLQDQEASYSLRELLPYAFTRDFL